MDWWALGVFLYELLTGKTPFSRADPVDTYKQICKGIDKLKEWDPGIDVTESARACSYYSS